MRFGNRIKFTPCKVEKNENPVPGSIELEYIKESSNTNNIILRVKDTYGVIQRVFLDISALMSLKQNIEEVYRETNLDCLKINKR